MMKMNKITAICYAVSAALFYALNIPCSKLLLDKIAPTLMAALLYLGAGLGVGIIYLFHYKKESPDERLARKDMPYVVGMVVLDIIAPILLMIGVKIGKSANASLLGNFEIVATSLIALFIFKEKVSRRLWTAIGFITLASITLSFSGIGSFSFSVGSLFVLGATACWGFENNCTRCISEKSTYQIVTIKGFGSGTGALLVAMLSGANFPQAIYIFPALLLGFIAYGLSIFTYIRAQKDLGAAKTSAFYAVAPFIGAFLSFILLHENLTISYITALIMMMAGTIFVIIDTLAYHHAHEHIHTFTHIHNGLIHTHTIRHCHDHDHYFSDERHGHRHSAADLEKLLTEH